MRLTQCECSGPGLCLRHQCHKSEPLYQLCRRNREVFDAWEAGRGPCLPIDLAAEVEEFTEGPGLVRRVLNFSKAAMRHTADRLRQADQATCDARLAICTQCPSCDTERLVCRQPACGCSLAVKVRWASERCPLGHWLEVPLSPQSS